MLKKLLKYDYRSTKRTIWPLLLAMGVAILTASLTMTLLVRMIDGSILTAVIGPYRTLLYIFFGLVTFVLFLGFAVGFLVCWILLVVRYFQDIATDTAYLTFTLPVSPTLLLVSKLLVAYFWTVLVSIVYVCGLAIFALVGTASNAFINNDLLEIILENAPRLFGYLAEGGVASMIISVLFLILSPLCSFINMYFAVTVAGVYFKRARVILCIGIVYGISAVESVIQQIVSFAYSIPQIATDSVLDMQTYMQITTGTVAIQLLVSIAVAAALFIWSCGILNKRLNLQ